jgi:hypothetical protein
MTLQEGKSTVVVNNYVKTNEGSLMICFASDLLQSVVLKQNRT